MSAVRLAKVGLKIPKRIERGPTDILKALASTVKYVPATPNAYLQDDPYLLPTRTSQKNQFQFAKASGKDTARFLLNRHPEIFFRDDSEPKILAYLPDEEFREDMDLTIEDLIWCLDNNDVSNGLIAYHSLMKKEVKLDKETLLKFFEMICFTNEKKTIGKIEAELLCLYPNDHSLVDMSWKEKGLASKIFNEFKDELDPERMYSTMIAGLSRFNQHTSARQVYDDFKTVHPGKGLYPIAYNSLLDSVINLHSDQQAYEVSIADILEHMEANSVAPDLGVFNSILKCYRRFRGNREATNRAFKLINDMRSLNIEPSFFTFECLISLISRDRMSNNKLEMIGSLLDYINQVELNVMKDPRDIDFLKNVMYVCVVRENSYNLAKKLHKIYMMNPNFFAHSSSKQEYMDRFFRSMITSDKIENTLEFYKTYVPSDYRPSPDTYDCLADALDLYGVDEETVLSIGKDTIKYGLSGRMKNDAIFKKIPAYEEAVRENQDRKYKQSVKGSPSERL